MTAVCRRVDAMPKGQKRREGKTTAGSRQTDGGRRVDAAANVDRQDDVVIRVGGQSSDRRV